jgi:pimeloyl-ACP methyl ester carboxylesterase
MKKFVAALCRCAGFIGTFALLGAGGFSVRAQSVELTLAGAGTNRPALAQAWERTPVARRDGMQFLLENMPERDLQTLPAEFLLENLTLAYDAFEQAPWHDRVPQEIFLNDVLPYASVTETRDAWRKILREKCAPLVADCKTPAEAAQRLNKKLFPLVKVKYSTGRKRADQSPFETMESGLASCTGLSVLLVDACRAVGVPARIAGTPMWANLSGNHTWVEVWDGGWHFTGAAEPDPKGLDHTWFEHNASQARKDERRFAIYASSFKKTGLSFPLDWAADVNWVSAVNVTDRYATNEALPEAGKMRLLVKVLDQLAGQRTAAKVTVADIKNNAVHFEGSSKDESADLNDVLPFDVPRGATYEIRAERDGQVAGREITTGTNAQALVVISLKDTTLPLPPAQVCYVPPADTSPLKASDAAMLKKSLTEFFTAPTNKQATWKFSGRLEKLLRDHEPAVRRVAWETYKSAPVHDALQRDYVAKQARFDEYLSPYTVKTVGERPKNGWALFIAMHGGGNTPKEVNDQQWQVMQKYYRDHPEAGGYLYVAVRAPNDTWNGFYDDYVYPLIANLVREFLLFAEVNPDKVFIMGYSHGGYGAFAIGPKEPDLFAAIHASAGAPTDGETTGKTLRNTIFTCMVGENDTMYGRFERDKKFRTSIQELRDGRTGIYPVTVQFIPGNGHTGLPDRDKIREMYPAVRNPVPRELTWLMTDKVIQDFFWLRTDAPGKKKEIDALCQENHLIITTTSNVNDARILLDSRLIDFKKPVTLELNGKSTKHQLRPSLRTLCETLQRRGDPELAFTAELPLPLATMSSKQ